MKILAYFLKTFKENIRDWKILSLTLVFAPFFVYLMYMYLNAGASKNYNVLVYNQDREKTFSAGLIKEWEKTASPEGTPVLNLEETADVKKAKKKIRDRGADLLIIIPADFSDSFKEYLKNRQGMISSIKSYGDAANPRYIMAAAFCDYITYSHLGAVTGTEIPMKVVFEQAGSAGKQLSEFDLYVPALMVFSIIMVLFTAAATLVREVEKGTITRLILSKLSTLEFLAAMSASQLIIGSACLALTYLSGYSVGYRSSGSIPLLMLAGLAVCFSVIAISILTACFIRTMFGLLTVGCFPFFILMFFSDCFMPLPKIRLFEVIGNQVFLNDILPTSIGVRAFNKILNFNAGFQDIAFELTAILLLGVAYFAIGAWLFKKRHMETSG